VELQFRPARRDSCGAGHASQSIHESLPAAPPVLAPSCAGNWNRRVCLYVDWERSSLEVPEHSLLGGVSAPRMTYAPDPEYSEPARQAGYQAVTVLWLVVGPDGLPRNISIAKPAGMGLDEQAVKAVRRWKLDPAKKDGNPVPVQINGEITFRLY
jgi:TonB family protein